jgi:hypothetical protein
MTANVPLAAVTILPARPAGFRRTMIEMTRELGDDVR